MTPAEITAWVDRKESHIPLLVRLLVINGGGVVVADRDEVPD